MASAYLAYRARNSRMYCISRANKLSSTRTSSRNSIFSFFVFFFFFFFFFSENGLATRVERSYPDRYNDEKEREREREREKLNKKN